MTRDRWRHASPVSGWRPALTIWAQRITYSFGAHLADINVGEHPRSPAAARGLGVMGRGVPDHPQIELTRRLPAVRNRPRPPVLGHERGPDQRVVPGDPEPTAEKIIDRALAYEPFAL